MKYMKGRDRGRSHNIEVTSDHWYISTSRSDDAGKGRYIGRQTETGVRLISKEHPQTIHHTDRLTYTHLRTLTHTLTHSTRTHSSHIYTHTHSYTYTHIHTRRYSLTNKQTTDSHSLPTLCSLSNTLNWTKEGHSRIEGSRSSQSDIAVTIWEIFVNTGPLP